ncbi:hypothetical protein HK099_001039 [Clydaea vesicula]|uniref:Peptidase M24 domain-containing protein n=1 Tax=Clydaea vesicula TaxID=447962 RepID=A0AAD5U417_9FUNG|nr:hypothetical protein HK099_001039 [Clydaea vesicula]KAJ3382648.1 hypothetical protein HDU92_004651 [Lobulomyces angularis]
MSSKPTKKPEKPIENDVGEAAEDAVEDEEVEANKLTAVNVTKYQAAAEVANRALLAVTEATVDGATVLSLCALGDKTINEGCNALYNKGKGKVTHKGTAFPTTVSPNSFLCHLSPLASDPEGKITIKTGDIVKIVMAAHIDGYIAQVGHTIVVGQDEPITGNVADVFTAAHLCGEAALRLLRPGNTNTQITDAMNAISKDFDCVPVEGMMSSQIAKNTLDGAKQILSNPNEQQKKETKEITFEEGEVYTMDILISAGEGKVRFLDNRTTIFKRDTSVNYSLKMQSSRTVFSEISKKFGSMAFSLQNLDDPVKGRLGMTECVTHKLVEPYQVLHEKEGVVAANFVFTVLLMPQGPLKITHYPWNTEQIKSEKKVVNETYAELLRTSVRPKKAKKAAKK